MTAFLVLDLPRVVVVVVVVVVEDDEVAAARLGTPRWPTWLAGGLAARLLDFFLLGGGVGLAARLLDLRFFALSVISMKTRTRSVSSSSVGATALRLLARRSDRLVTTGFFELRPRLGGIARK